MVGHCSKLKRVHFSLKAIRYNLKKKKKRVMLLQVFLSEATLRTPTNLPKPNFITDEIFLLLTFLSTVIAEAIILKIFFLRNLKGMVWRFIS